MGYLNGFATWVAKAVAGESPTPYNNASAYIAVGDGTATVAEAQTDLQGTNKTRLPMDVGYPTRSSASTTYRSTADEATANHGWQEWGIVNASTAGDMMCRFLQDMGTKASGIQRQITVTVNHLIATGG